MKILLPIFVFACACTNSIPAPNYAENAPIKTDTTTSAIPSAPIPLDGDESDTTLPIFNNVYDFLNAGHYGISSQSIDQFETSWYASTKQLIDNDTMYLNSKHEGGVLYGSIFTKIKGRWIMIEDWDASN